MARFYVSRTMDIKDFTCEELTKALDIDASLLPQIIRQGALLPGICLYWRNYGGSLQAHARFLSLSMALVFLTFSYADM